MLSLLILFRGLASNKIISALGKTKFPVEVVDSMKKAFEIVKVNAKKAISFYFLLPPPVSGYLKTNLIGGTV